jgi:ligand-binding sensor domain-containing protein
VILGWNVTAVSIDADDQVWIGGEHGLARFDDGNWDLWLAEGVRRPACTGGVHGA